MKSQKAFTLLELLITMSLIALLIGISIPTFFTFRKHINTTKCLSRAQQLYSGAQKMFDDMNPETAKSTEQLSSDMKWWQRQLKAYGVPDEAWYDPTQPKHQAGDLPDFFYGGVCPKDFFYAEDRDQLYLFVGKNQIYSSGNVVVMADGTVKFEKFFPE
ncbi:MAG: type II secretion system GspH family protein [Verrucomicrobiae bacterium]|nr:type II secretion system GspH family protein [Verrucomicrobiae bacterium]